MIPSKKSFCRALKVDGHYIHFFEPGLMASVKLLLMGRARQTHTLIYVEVPLYHDA
jgi:hypothetical protein